MKFLNKLGAVIFVLTLSPQLVSASLRDHANGTLYKCPASINFPITVQLPTGISVKSSILGAYGIDIKFAGVNEETGTCMYQDANKMYGRADIIPSNFKSCVRFDDLSLSCK